jgi:hypothetical protein
MDGFTASPGERPLVRRPFAKNDPGTAASGG